MVALVDKESYSSESHATGDIRLHDFLVGRLHILLDRGYDRIVENASARTTRPNILPLQMKLFTKIDLFIEDTLYSHLLDSINIIKSIQTVERLHVHGRNSSCRFPTSAFRPLHDTSHRCVL